MTHQPNSGGDLPARLNPRALPAAQVTEALRNDEAYRLRMGGATYGEIAKALKIPGGWVEAYGIVSTTYGKLVADLEIPAIRAREAGRLMDMRAGIEADVRKGDIKMIEADIRMSERIAKLLGLDADSGGGSGGGGVQVQINVAPPWEREPAPPPTIEGEAVED